MLMQAACPQLQESSILSRTTFAQYGPQYLLPFSGAQLQAGCAHLSCVFVWRSLEVFSAIIVAPLLRTGVVVPRRHLGMRCPVRPSTRLRLSLNTSRGGSRWFRHQACLAPRYLGWSEE